MLGLCDPPVDEAQALFRIKSLDRRRCRQVFEKRFTAQRMASDYLSIYEQLQRKLKQQVFAAEESFHYSHSFDATLHA